MSHLHSVYDNDTHFKIDPVTRQIKNESGKLVLMQNDHNSERFSFDIPRYIDGHDMSACNMVEVHFINMKSDKTEKHANVYLVDDFRVSPTSPDRVTFSWLISQNATKYAGSLSFLVKFKCITDGAVSYMWSTDTYCMTVSSGIDNGEIVAEEYSDILAEWEERIGSVEKYLKENPLETLSKAAIGFVELFADKWVGDENLYSQVVSVKTLDGVNAVTENSQVDLTPSVEQLAVFYHKDLALVAENDGGVVTVYAIGQKPENDYTIQVTITEVIS